MRSILMLGGLLRLFGYAADPLLDRHEIHEVVGQPSRLSAPPGGEAALRVVSWNIAQGKRYEEVRDALAGLDADIYLLQEVDLAAARSDYREVARDLADDLGGLNWVFAGEFQEIGLARGRTAALTGQAILSRYPIADAVVLRFENQATLRWRLDPLQPRRGGRIALRAQSAGVVFYNAHVESAKDDSFRHRQVDEMVLDHRRAGFDDDPVMLAGDFNTAKAPHDSMIVRCLVAQGFVDALGPLQAPRRTSVNHRDPLDWIFVRNMTPEAGRVVGTGKTASDHYPLQAMVLPTFASQLVER